MENGSINEREFSLYDLYMIVRKHLILIFSLVLIGAVVAGALAWFVMDEQYKAEAQIIVQVETTGTTNEIDTTTSLRLINTVSTLLSSDLVLLDVNETLNLGYTTSQMGIIRSNLNVISSTTDLFITISYTDTDPEVARDVVNQVIESAKAITNDENSSIQFLQGVIGTMTPAPIGRYDSPNKPLYVIIGALLGGIVGVSIALVSGFLDNTYKTKEEIQRDLDLQVLGSIPEFRVEEDF